MKILLSAVVIIGFVLYSFFGKSATQSLPVKTKETVNSSAVSSGMYKDGMYTGKATDAFYGTIQVQATVQNGNIADVQFLQYPHSQDTSIQVNKAAMPELKQEAIAAQNANVDVVSGATQTSQAFNESLADALTQAK
jgi:uncharacterized protein with FMN-binding domain